MRALERDIGAIGVKLDVDSNQRAKPLRLTEIPPQPPFSEVLGSSQVLDLLVRAALAAALRVLSQSPDIAERLATILGTPPVRDGSRLLATKADYASRLSYSIRKLDELVAAGLPTVGVGRALRIPVAAADDWVLARLGGSRRYDDLEIAALANAKRRGRRRAL